MESLFFQQYIYISGYYKCNDKWKRLSILFFSHRPINYRADLFRSCDRFEFTLHQLKHSTENKQTEHVT